ncbi:MAG: DUF2173 family protein [Gammaproteobacteria bacterium]
MIKRLLILDGVFAICRFRDDGSYVEGYGVMPEEMMRGLAKFAHDYKRMVQGNTDQLAMFTQVSGWTPPGGWIVRGKEKSVCSVGNLACLVDHKEGSVSDVMKELADASSY